MNNLALSLAVGFALAAPIGPVGVLCIRRALADGRLAAFVAALGAALADAVFGSAAVLGLGAVTGFLDANVALIKAVGGVFMLGLGVHTWRTAAVAVEAEPGEGPGMARDFASTFVITITNPGTVLGAMAVAAAVGHDLRPGEADPPVVVLGVFAGSALWWLILSGMAAAARARVTPERMRRLNHVSGGLLLVFGAVALVLP